MNDNVIAWPLIPRPYPPHVSLLDRIKRDREASKATVQELTDAFRITVWRSENLGNAMMWCDRMARHQNGGKEWVLSALEELRKYVEERN